MHSAAEHYDIGYYYEANGHGSILIKSWVFEEI